MPRIALTAGRPWFAYDLAVHGHCLYQEAGDPVPSSLMNEIWRGARLVEQAP